MATCFNVPPLLPSSNLGNVSKTSSINLPAEKDLDDKLALLRSEIHRAVTAKTKLEGEISLLDKELREHGGLTLISPWCIQSELTPCILPGRIADQTAAYSSLLCLPSDEVAENAPPPSMAVSLAAISTAVQKLQPLLQKAQTLRGQRRPLSVVQNANVEVELKASAMVRACGELAEIQGVLQATV